MIKAIKLIILTIVINLTTGCARETFYKGVSIEPEFLSYFNKFKSNGSKQGKQLVVDNLIIKMLPDLGKYTVGTCQKLISDVETPLIHINKIYWDKFNDEQKEFTIFHEMGHCILNRDHRDDKNNTYPLSVMNSFIFNYKLYISNYDQYQHELFLNEDLNDALPLKLNSFMTSNSIESKSLEHEHNSEVLTDDELGQIRCEDGVVYIN